MDTRKIDLAAIGIIIVLVAFAYLFLFKENRATAALLKEQESVLLDNLRAAGDMGLALDRIEEEIEAIQNNLDTFNRQLPEEKRIYDFLVQLDTLARQNNMNLKSVRPGSLDAGTLYSRVPINISGYSRFKDFYTFLYQLENIPRITKIEHVRVNSVPDGNRCDIDIDLAIFVGGE